MAFNDKIDNIVIENAEIIFKNFSGQKTKFNREGSRTFCVVIDDPEYADKLAEDGWNIKKLEPRDEEDEPRFYIQVQVSFDYYPPTVYMVTKKSKTPLNDETIETLDYASIKSVDLSIRPYHWSVDGKEGIKAYLRTLYVVIDEDEFADKYNW